jgi:microcystin-dependent protein
MNSYIGMVFPFATGSYVPQGFYSCEGQSLQISQYQALYTLLGTTYGGDGINNFMLPDLRGRGIVGAGAAASGTNYVLGASHDLGPITLTTANLPVHEHTIAINANSANQNVALPTNNILGGGSTTGNALYSNAIPGDSHLNSGSVTIASAGSSVPTPIDTHSPYLAMYYGICWEGLFPVHP